MTEEFAQLALARWLKQESIQKRFDEFWGRVKPTSPVEHLEHMLRALSAGARPCEETDFFITTSIAVYLEAEGKISLDEAFLLSGKRKVGNPSAQLARKKRFDNALIQMILVRHETPGLPLRKTAEIALSQLKRSPDEPDSVDVDTLIREWGRQKMSRFEPKRRQGK